MKSIRPKLWKIDDHYIYKGVAPLVLFLHSIFGIHHFKLNFSFATLFATFASLAVKKTIPPFWRILIFQIDVNPAKTRKLMIIISTKMSHRWCYSYIRYSAFIILNLFFLCDPFYNLRVLGGKNNHPSVLANPYFLDCRQSGQNPETAWSFFSTKMSLLWSFY